MVEKFNLILNRIKSEKGPVLLFAILKMDEITDKWSVLISATWAPERNIEIFKYLNDLLKEYLTEEEGASIARIGVFPAEDHFVELLSKFRAGTKIIDTKVNGNLVHEGYVIDSSISSESEFVPVPPITK